MLKTIAGIIIGLIIGVPTAGFAVQAHSQHEVPNWMNKECKGEDSDNCTWDGGEAGRTERIYSRNMPGGKIRCVFFTVHPKWDYCQRR